MRTTSLRSVAARLRLCSDSLRQFSSGAHITQALQTHSSNLAGLGGHISQTSELSAEGAWREWLCGKGNAAAAGLLSVARDSVDWTAVAYLSYALWYHDGVPAVHVQAARWASWDLAVAAVKTAPLVAPSEQGHERAAFAAACTVLHMLAARRWGKLPIAKPAVWLRKAALAPEAGSKRPYEDRFVTLAHCQVSQASGSTHDVHDALQRASASGLLPASHAYAQLLRRTSDKSMPPNLAAFFGQPWASIARANAAQGWPASNVLLGQSLLQAARAVRKSAGSKQQPEVFKHAVQMQRSGADFLHTAANAGSIDAAAALGVMLRSGGAGMAPHLPEAQRLLHHAASHGHINAMFHLALLFKEAGSRDGYVEWLQEAAKGGHQAAQQHLGREQPAAAAAILSGQ